MKKLILFFFILMASLSFSQSFKSGLILPKNSDQNYSGRFCCMLSPAEGFAAYDKPNGKIVGKIARLGNVKTDDQVAYHIYFITENKNQELENLEQVSSEIYALKYTDSKEGFVKAKTPVSEVWLKISAIEKQGFEPVIWRDYLVNNSEKVLGYYANEPGLQLRKAPNTTGEIIGSVRGDLFEIKLTKEISGNWCKVKVSKYREHPCNTDISDEKNLEYRSEGWIKIIDDQGESNLWNYARGC